MRLCLQALPSTRIPFLLSIRHVLEMVPVQNLEDGISIKIPPAVINYLYVPALVVAVGTPKTTSAAWLAAVAATLGVPASSCITVASSSDLINAAVAAGMLPVAVPRKMAYAASYPAAAAKFEAFGPGYATWQKLVGVWQRQQQQQ